MHRVSIVPRGRALGYTLNLPDEDRYLKTREELIDYMTMLLGGRAAEQIVFGAVTTGAADDLRRASEVAGAMITDYAMGTTVAVTGRGSPLDERVSEQTLRLRDEEREELLHRRAPPRCGCSTAQPRDARRAGARSCRPQEVLERAAIERIVAQRRAAAPAPRAPPRASDAEADSTERVAARAPRAA